MLGGVKRKLPAMASGVTVVAGAAAAGRRGHAVRGSGSERQAADTKAVTGDHDEATPPQDGTAAGRRLRAVRGPVVGQVSPPAVRLWREFKGATVADLLRSEFVDRLPGQVRSALQHLERGDPGAAERALPGGFPPVLPGPGVARGRQRAVVAALAIVVVIAATALALWMVA